MNILTDRLVLRDHIIEESKQNLQKCIDDTLSKESKNVYL